MITITRRRIQYLNGSNVVSEIPVPISERTFESEDEFNEFRKKKELKLQYKLDQRFAKENPHATEDEYSHRTKVSVLYDIKSKHGYIQPLLPKHR